MIKGVIPILDDVKRINSFRGLVHATGKLA